MQKIAPSARSLQRAKVMWEQSNDDLRTARDLQNSNPELSCLQSVQAAINALSSLLEAQGFFQLPSYSAVNYWISVFSRMPMNWNLLARPVMFWTVL